MCKTIKYSARKRLDKVFLKYGKMSKIDIDKLICALMVIPVGGPVTLRKWLEMGLSNQGLEFKDGEILSIYQDSKEDSDSIWPKEITDELEREVWCSSQELIRQMKKVTSCGKPDINAMVEKFKYNLQADNDESIKYIPVDGIVDAYRKGLEDMYNELMKQYG